MGFLSILEDVSLVRKHGSHYRFLNNDKSIGLQKLNIETIDNNANIFKVFKLALRQILDDIEVTEGGPLKSPKIICGDSKSTKLNSNSIDLVITSPPYLNRNNYIAQQKSELDFLHMINNKNEYKEIVKSTFRSHTDSELPKDSRSSLSEINTIIKSIQLEEGNNMKIPHMISGYFDDINNLLIELFRLVKKGGQCAFVLGNTRWGGIVVPVDHLVVKIAEDIGFRCKKILVTRYKGNSPQQMKKYGRIPVRESIIIFSK